MTSYPPSVVAPLTTRMRGGAAIVEALARGGIDTVFGLPGVQIYELFDALGLAKDRITTITPRHEQATAYMAFGYAKSTGKTGAFAVVPGPGMLNASAAALTAHSATTPMIGLTGQVPSQFIGRGRGHLHDLPDQLATLRSFLKNAHRVDHPSQAPAAVAAALHEARSGRAGVVALEMAWDVMSQESLVTFDPRASDPVDSTPLIDPVDIGAAADMIRRAKRPMIMTGGGALEAGPEILALAERLGAPVVAHRGGRGVVNEAHPLGMPGYPGYLLWPDVDLLIGIGTRLEMPYLRWDNFVVDTPRPATPKLIRIDIDAFEMTRVRPDAAIVGDAKLATGMLIEALGAGAPTSDWGSGIAEAKARARAEMVERLQPQLDYLDVIREVLPADGIFVEELSQLGFASWVGFPVLAPRTYISAGAQGTLGFGYATALGAKVGNPDKAVVSVTGDGGLMFGLQELSTAVEYGIGVVAIVVNNGGYANVRRDQEARFAGREFRASFHRPDFAKVADAFGIAYACVGSPAELRPVLAAAIAANVPALIEIPMDPGTEAAPWPFLHPKGAAGK